MPVVVNPVKQGGFWEVNVSAPPYVSVLRGSLQIIVYKHLTGEPQKTKNGYEGSFTESGPFLGPPKNAGHPVDTDFQIIS